MGKIENRGEITVDSLSQTCPGNVVSQKYFRVDELKPGEEIIEKLVGILPVLRSYIHEISKDLKNTEILLPKRFMFSEDASSAYLCFDGFAEGPRIDHLGEMIEGRAEPDGSFSLRTSEKVIREIPLDDLGTEISQQITEIQARVPAKHRLY